MRVAMVVPILMPMAAWLLIHQAHADLPLTCLRPGEFHFRLGGTQSFLLGRNPTGWQVEQLVPLLEWAGESGERIARVHITIGWPMDAPAGQVDEAWAVRWDGVLDLAAEHGVYVLPVFGVWGQWNDGSRGETWHFWDANPFNSARGGPAQAPAELLRDTECRRLWLAWLAALVKRWAPRPNVLGWEVFSELDLITGSTESDAAAFIQRAAQVLRAADPASRPITGSLSGTRDWPSLSASPALDFVQVHPYGPNLSDLILSSVRDRLRRYRKPVFIGECGLSADPPARWLASSPRAHVGINHAIWASVVSGAMNGRMLWWEDGYDQYERLDLRTQYKHASLPAARFIEGLDFAGLAPIDTETSPDVTSAALGRDDLILVWLRDARCLAPDWPVRRVEGARVQLLLPTASGPYAVSYYATSSGTVTSTHTAYNQAGRLDLSLPAFEDSLALRLERTAAAERGIILPP